jgi:dihydrofolate reductase
MVVGGAQVYRAFLPRASRLYWTVVQAHVGGDTFFPALDLGDWVEVGREERPADGANAQALSFRVMERR